MSSCNEFLNDANDKLSHRKKIQIIFYLELYFRCVIVWFEKIESFYQQLWLKNSTNFNGLLSGWQFCRALMA